MSKETSDKKQKPKEQKVVEKTTNEDVITLDIQPFLTPIAILLGSIIISISLLIGLNGVDGVSTTTTTGDTAAADPGAIAAEFPEASTSIDDDPIKGNRDTARIAIVEFSDYECPFCQRHYQQTYDDLVEKYVDTGDAILVFRDFPLSFHDPLATQQAMAAECVQELGGDGKYFEYHDLLFSTTQSGGTGMDESELGPLAEQIGINSGQFAECYDSERYREEVEKDLADGQAAGITGTPGFVVGVLHDDGTVNGKIISGAYPLETFDEIIGEYL